MSLDRINCEAYRVSVPIEDPVTVKTGIAVSAVWKRGVLRKALDLHVDSGNKQSFPQSSIESWRLLLSDESPPEVKDDHVIELSLDGKVVRGNDALLPSEPIEISLPVEVPIGAAALVALIDYGTTPYNRGAARIVRKYSDPGYVRLYGIHASVDKDSSNQTRIAGISAVLIPEGRFIVIPQGQEDLRYYRLTYNVGELLLKSFEPEDVEGESDNTDDDWGGHPRPPKDPLIRDEAAVKPEPDSIITEAFPPRLQ